MGLAITQTNFWEIILVSLRRIYVMRSRPLHKNKSQQIIYVTISAGGLLEILTRFPSLILFLSFLCRGYLGGISPNTLLFT